LHRPRGWLVDRSSITKGASTERGQAIQVVDRSGQEHHADDGPLQATRLHANHTMSHFYPSDFSEGPEGPWDFRLEINNLPTLERFGQPVAFIWYNCLEIEGSLIKMKPRHQFEPASRTVMVLALCYLLSVPAPYASGATSTTTQTLDANISPIGKVSVPSTVSMIRSASTFTGYTATITVSYKARTTSAGTGGTITMQASSDFSPAGGPLVTSGNLTYVCSGSTLGTNCAGTQTVSTSVATPVITLPTSACTGGGGVCSASNPNTVSVNLTLADPPAYSTGTYSANVTFTISAT